MTISNWVYLLCLCLFFLLFSGSEIKAQSISMQSYGADEGLVGQVVFDIIQGPEGKMWIITDKALNIFDGQNWTAISEVNGESLPNYRYSRLHYNELTNEIFVLGYIRDTSFKIFSSKNGEWKTIKNPIINEGYFHSVYNEEEQYLWLVSSFGIINCYDIKNDIWSTKFIEGVNVLNASIFNGSYTLFTNKGIITLKNTNNGIKTLTTIKPELNEKNVEVIINDKVYSNQVIIFQKDKFFRADNFTFNISHIRTIGIESETEYPSLIQVEQTKKDNLYIISNNQFFIANESGEVEAVYSTDIDNEQWINRFFVDKTNVVWLATNKGVKKIDSFMFRHFDKKNGIHQNEVTTINQFNDGSVFIGQNDGFQIYKNRDLSTFYKINSKKPTNRFLASVHNNKFDRLYVAGTMSGLHEVNNDYILNNVNNNTVLVTDVLLKNDSLFYVIDDFGVNLLYDDKSIEYLKIDGNQFSYIRKLYYSNRLLVLTNRGVFDASEMKLIYTGINDEQKMSSSSYCLIPHNKGYLVGTVGGLVYWNGVNDDENKLIEVNGRPLHMSIYTAIFDKYDRLWLGTNKGVYIINANFTKVRIIDKGDGLLSNEINRGALKEMMNGDIYIGTDKGLSIYRAKFDEVNLNPPSAKISTNIEKSILNNNIKYNFNISIPNYYNISSHLIRYKLNGFDEDFIQIERDKLHEISYTNLLDGNYQLEVQVKQRNSKWSNSYYSEEILVENNIVNRYLVTFFAMIIVSFLSILATRRFYIKN